MRHKSLPQSSSNSCIFLHMTAGGEGSVKSQKGMAVPIQTKYQDQWFSDGGFLYPNHGKKAAEPEDINVLFWLGS